MTTFLRDVRFGTRLLRRSPAFTVVGVATLALGISATTAIFSVVYGLFFAPLPYRQADRLVMVWEQDRGRRVPVSPRSFVAWQRQSSSFTELNAWSGSSVNLATDDRPENVLAGIATPGFLGMLGYGHPLALGRTFTDEEGVAGHEKVVVLTYQLWQNRFAGDPRIVGRQVRIDDASYTVVGVLGKGPADHQQNKIWLPLVLTDAQIRDDNHWLYVMARLKDGVAVAEANASMAVLSASLERERPARQGWSVSVEQFRNDFVADSTKRGVWLLLGAVLFLLLIACANVANLLLARGTARRRELAIRVAMGANRGAIVRQLLVESLILALAGGALGALLTSSIIGAIVALMPPFTLPSEAEIALNTPVLIFAFVVCTLAGVVAGSLPAWQASRRSLADTMKEGGRSIGDARFGLRRALVVIEFALALTLLSGGAVAARALASTVTADLGFRADHLLTFWLPVPRGKLDTPDRILAFYGALADRVASLPGVSSAAVSTAMPVTGGRFGRAFEIVGRPPSTPESRLETGVNMVTPSYHETFGIRIFRGRAFLETDRPGSPPVAIVNQRFVSIFLAGVDPVGQRIQMSPIVPGFAATPPAPVEWQIVGVQADTSNAGAGRPTVPELLIPFAQNPWPRANVAVRSPADATTLRASIASIVAGLDPTLPMADVRSMEESLSESMASDRFYTIFLAAFAGIALTLAAIGIYGVMSFAVAQRTHEIGLRMALGGQRLAVLAQILREGVATAVAGTAVGAVGAVLIGRALQGTIYGVEPANPLTFAAVALTLVAAALVACLVPARRAASVDPMVALREP